MCVEHGQSLYFIVGTLTLDSKFGANNWATVVFARPEDITH
jgi:hypothetical protein